MRRFRDPPSPFSQGARAYLPGMTADRHTTDRYDGDSAPLLDERLLIGLLRMPPSEFQQHRAKDFPPPCRHGDDPNDVGWRVDDVNRWLIDRGWRGLLIKDNAAAKTTAARLSEAAASPARGTQVVRRALAALVNPDPEVIRVADEARRECVKLRRAGRLPKRLRACENPELTAQIEGIVLHLIDKLRS